MTSERSPQQSYPPTQPLSLRNTVDFKWGMQQVWETQMQQEHVVIADRAYELFEKRGREHGRDCEDWFRAESELHLNE